MSVGFGHYKSISLRCSSVWSGLVRFGYVISNLLPFHRLINQMIAKDNVGNAVESASTWTVFSLSLSLSSYNVLNLNACTMANLIACDSHQNTRNVLLQWEPINLRALRVCVMDIWLFVRISLSSSDALFIALVWHIQINATWSLIRSCYFFSLSVCNESIGPVSSSKRKFPVFSFRQCQEGDVFISS